MRHRTMHFGGRLVLAHTFIDDLPCSTSIFDSAAEFTKYEIGSGLRFSSPDQCQPPRSKEKMYFRYRSLTGKKQPESIYSQLDPFRTSMVAVSLH
jgi:hypothetical protein